MKKVKVSGNGNIWTINGKKYLQAVNCVFEKYTGKDWIDVPVYIIDEDDEDWTYGYAFRMIKRVY